MVDKKNLADIVERLLDHLSTKAEGHYKSQVIAKLISISSQRDYKYITDFEWYIGVLARLTRVPGNEQGKAISDQLLDVAVRVDVVRRFAVKQMMQLLQDQRFYALQSQIVEVLYAAAFIVGEFSEPKDSVSLISSLLDPQIKNIPGHIQSVCMSSAVKIFSRLAVRSTSGSKGDLLSLNDAAAPAQSSSGPDERAVQALQSCLSLFEKNLPVFAESEVVEVQERACFAQQVLRMYHAVGDVTMALELVSLFSQTLNPVHPDAQSMVQVPEGLDLQAQINAWPEEEPESMSDDSDAESNPLSEFGGYQHPTGAGTSTKAPATGGPIDRRFYLSGSVLPSGSATSVVVPETEPLDLGGMKIVVKEPRKKQGKKHQKAKVVTELALPTGASPPPRRNTAGSSSSQAAKDALSAVNLDEDLTVQEKDLLQHKTYPVSAPGSGTLKKDASPSPAVAPTIAPSPPTTTEEPKKRKGKKGKSKESSSKSSSAPAAAAPQSQVQPDPSAPQVMCGASDKISAICRVLAESANPKQVTVQIAVQNKTAAPLQALFDIKTSSAVIKLVSRSLPNPLAVPASGLAPLLCVFEVVSPVNAPLAIECSITPDKGVTPVAASFVIQPSQFVIPQDIALDELGRRISKMAQQLQSASASITCGDQKQGLKQISERIRVKKVRIDSGAALFYGKTVFDLDVFVHVKRTSETSMMIEIKCLEKALAASLVTQAAGCVK